MLEWRNWQRHGTQNPASFTGYEGSTPSSSTNYFIVLAVGIRVVTKVLPCPTVTVLSPRRFDSLCAAAKAASPGKQSDDSLPAHGNESPPRLHRAETRAR